MLKNGVNLEDALVKRRKKSQKAEPDEVLNAFKRLLKDQDKLDEEIVKNIFQSKEEANSLDYSRLNPDMIFTENDIKKLCEDYRLRFLSAKYFKGEIPYEGIAKVRRLQKDTESEIINFKIMAPAVMFNLVEKDKDPLLFVPLGNERYYLVHKWGRDLHPLRRLLVFPFRSFQTLLGTVAGLALLIAIMLPNSIVMGPYDSTSLNIRVIFFFYLFLAFSGLTALYGFSRLKNFNSTLWNSRYLD